MFKCKGSVWLRIRRSGVRVSSGAPCTAPGQRCLGAFFVCIAFFKAHKQRQPIQSPLLIRFENQKKACFYSVPGSGRSPAFPRPSIPAGRFLPMRVVLDGGVCCIPAASEADHSTKEVNTSYRNNIFDFQGTTIKTPNHFTTVGVWCTLTKVKLYCKLSRR